MAYNHPLRTQISSGVSARYQRQEGIALLLVIFVVALASILVLNVAYSTNLGSRLNAHAQRGLEAEYLLKSAINVARTMLSEDKTPEDSFHDDWGTLVNGMAIPPELLGLPSSNIRIEMELRPEESKLPLRMLVPSGGTPDTKWRDALVRLMRELGFDDDEELDQTGLFPERHFTSEELVANLIDYMDEDKESYNAGSFAPGIEGDINDEVFPNARIQRISELSSIPGYTPARLRKLTPFVTTTGNNRVNINIAPAAVLKALDENIGNAEIDLLLAFRKGDDGPFNDHNKSETLVSILSEDVYNRITPMISVQSSWFQVLAKVDNGTSTYFMRAYLRKTNVGSLPEIRSVELF